MSEELDPVEVWAAVKGETILWWITARTRSSAWSALASELHFGKKAWWTEGTQETPAKRDRARRRGYDVVKATIAPGWEGEA